MLAGRNYFIVYNDGQTERGRFLTFVRQEGRFLVFKNPRTNQEELIHEDRIIRMEERA